eukprot:923313-Amphidinium_carterae.1
MKVKALLPKNLFKRTICGLVDHADGTDPNKGFLSLKAPKLCNQTDSFAVSFWVAKNIPCRKRPLRYQDGVPGVAASWLAHSSPIGCLCAN